MNRHAFRAGVLLTLVSNVAFAAAGPVAKAMYATGWTPGPVVMLRLLGCALVLSPIALGQMRGQWHLVPTYWKEIVSYGVISMAGVQLLFFLAVDKMQVSLALLLEMTAPLIIVAYLWAKTRVRPAVPTFIGMLLALSGLLVVLDPRGASLNLAGVLFALGAACCLASFFMVGAKSDNPIPPLPMLCFGMLAGGIVVGAVCATRVIPTGYSFDRVQLATITLPWWTAMAIVVLVTVTAYAFGVLGLRLIGASLGAFVNLLEVPFSVLISWWLLAELPHAIQAVGGVLIVAGVVFIKLGEKRRARRTVDLDDVAPAASPATTAARETTA